MLGTFTIQSQREGLRKCKYCKYEKPTVPIVLHLTPLVSYAMDTTVLLAIYVSNSPLTKWSLKGSHH